QIWVAAANSVSAARPMVDALRLSTLQNYRTGPAVGWIRRAARCQGLGTPVVRAASTKGLRDAAQIWNCWARAQRWGTTPPRDTLRPFGTTHDVVTTRRAKARIL
ncbi:hypothetical protein, partial [uncultured Lamprocystis sp.]|uniref:hypothetical protein n=1 Tax=uncultured Lamprocystis sp. TaxID=543132 RepID=UPI0025D06176